jgi:hypothetical protein
VSPDYPGFAHTHFLTANAFDTESGVDFVLPLSKYGLVGSGYGSIFSYSLEAFSCSDLGGSISANTTFSAELRATLSGVELIDANGSLVSHATFGDDGTASRITQHPWHRSPKASLCS